MVYRSPDELKKAVTPYESLDGVPPNEVYAGRKEAILQWRKEKND